MSKCPVLNKEGKETDQLELPDEIFKEKVNDRIIHQAIVKYQAALRQGNASTKEKADVSGGGAKPYRQKGTGRARAGSNRSPIWSGGGVTFGPHPRDFSYSLPKKIKNAAFRESVSAKYQDKKLQCITDLTDPLEKTKDFAKIIKNLKLDGKILAILDGSDKSISLVSRNLPRFSMMRAQDVNCYDILRNKYLLTTKTGLTKILDRIKK